MSKPTTVSQYLAALPKERRDALNALRKVIKANLDPAFREGLQYGMIGYFIPHSVYPDGYHCDPSQPLPFGGLASQKNHLSLYLFCVYSSEEEQKRFREAWLKTGKKLDMGKSCIRFKNVEDVPLDVIGRTIKRVTARKFIKIYENAFGDRRKPARKAAKKPGKKAAKKAAGRKAARKPAKKKASHKPAARRARR